MRANKKSKLVTITTTVCFSLFMVASGVFNTAVSAPNSSWGITSGVKCTVISGPNKGKKGTYKDGWCEGSWGGTECRGNSSTKCKGTKAARLQGSWFKPLLQGGKNSSQRALK